MQPSLTCALLTGGMSLLAAPLDADRAPDADAILAAAHERIRHHRMDDLTVVVRHTDGRPVPGATVRVQQQRHAFLFGGNVFALGAFDEPLNRAYAERFAALFNYATVPFYWASFEGQRGQPEDERLDRMVAWADAHHLRLKGHPLVWTHPASSPSWLPDDPAEVLRLSDERVREIVARYRGRIDTWDVVNEMVDGWRFDNAMVAASRQRGQVPFTVEPFRIARQANPEATLLINDYRTDEAYVELIRQLVDPDSGRPVYDVIGLQSHMHSGVWPIERLWSVLETYAQFGVPLHFTELTVLSGHRDSQEPIDWNAGGGWGASNAADELRQRDAVVALYTTLFSHPAVQAITWWDFTDRGAWLNAAAGLLRGDMSPKPAYDALLARIKGTWWTDATVTTDAEGRATLRVFHGDHRVSTGPTDAELTVSRGGDNTVTLRVDG